MKRNFLKLLLLLIAFIVFLPYGVYWIGLSNLNGHPKPVRVELSAAERQEVWLEYSGIGSPRIEKIGPYGYLVNIYCQIKNGVNSAYCFEKYPGIYHAALAVKPQLFDKLKKKQSINWQITWMAYTIWISNHWSIEEVLDTLGATDRV